MLLPRTLLNLAGPGVVAALLPVLLASLSFAASPPQSNDDWLKETETWRENRERQLRSADGWLAVTGLHWLETGTVRFGSAPDCEIRLSADSSPALAGTLTVVNGLVLFSAAPAATLNLNGKPSASGTLSLEDAAAEADSPDRLAIGSSTLQLLRRSGRLAVRTRDSSSPRIQSFPGERWFPPAPAWRLSGRFIPAAPETPLELKNVRGNSIRQELAGVIEFEYHGQTFQLQAVTDQPGSALIIFRDQTSGQQTWPGGRFLSVKIPADNTPLLIDFNRASNPPCAYNPHTLCPLPPKANQLPVPVTAGALQPHQNP